MTTKLTEHDTTVDGATGGAVNPADDIAETTGTTAEQDTYPYILHGVDPRKLRADGNSRAVGDVRERRPELVASIAEHGVDPKISMISVAPHPDGSHEVLVGFHRTAAASAVKESEKPGLSIPVVVHEPGTTRQDVLVAQAIENLHREGYTQAEEGAVYEQLALTGLDEDAIAQKVTRPVERVRARRHPAHPRRQRNPARC